jgi:DNA-directed RNA polymerase beta subunit
MDSDPELPWKVINRLFNDDPQMMIRHHIDSYNDFFGKGIFKIFRERNPIILQKEQDPDTQEFNLRCELYLGGKNGDKVYFGKPVIYDDDREHYMFPNEARLRNMTYGTTIHYDVDVVFKIAVPDSGEGGTGGGGRRIEVTTATLERILLGRFPIMIQSNHCILHGLEPKARFYMGECKNDYGGYFIIDGKEKTIISQEKFADNMIYIRENNEDNVYTHAADIRTVSEDASKPERTLSVRIVAPTSLLTNKQIVVNIPNVRSPVPLFIVMRALGVISDRDILEFCLLDLDENAELLDNFIPSIHDANKIFTQEGAIKFIATLTKSKTIPQVHDILMNYFLPQVGETNYIQKAYFLGNMVYKLLRVSLKIDAPTDRDSFKFKRIELSGALIFDLFKEYYALQQQHIRLSMDREYFKDPKKYEKNFVGLIQMNYQEFFRERIVENGFKKAFKGNWGATEHTKRIGVIQDLNRLSYNSFLSHLRKINLPMDSSAKIVKPRMLHGSQWGMIDPVDSPDGANIGFHKHLAFGTRITNHCSAYPMTLWLREVVKMHLLEESTRMFLYYTTKVFVNGTWVGAVTRPEETMRLIRLHRRNALIPIYISCRWDIKNNEIHIYTDAGRLCRPIFYIDEETGRPSYDKDEILEMIRGGKASWEQMTTGFTAKSDPTFQAAHCNYYTIDELYGRAHDTSALSAKQKVSEDVARVNTIQDFRRLKATQAIIEYIDTSETESTLISMTHKFERPVAASTGTGSGSESDSGSGSGSSESESEGESEKEEEVSEPVEEESDVGSRGTGGLSPRTFAKAQEVDRRMREKLRKDAQTGGAGGAAAVHKHRRKHRRRKHRRSSSSKRRSNSLSADGKHYTHVEIHPSLVMGVMGNQICFPENNPVARNVFGCGQAKQAASLYHSNYQVRIDKMGVVINNGETPIVKSRYLDLINREEHPCGFNAIVAIMSFNGYNVEDSILFNEASIKRGMFRITYYNMYEAREESSSVRGAQRDTRFANIQKEGAIGIKPGYDYSYLDDNGLIRENTEMDDKKVVIGMGSVSIQNEGAQMRDMSTMPKKGQLGFVDKAFMTEGETGFRIGKVRIREERFPSIGDKFCSRCGQKGTVGLIIPEKDMPFTKDGIRPDIIINPHAIPTRMTIGQLIESLMGKACVLTGGFGNCTAYTNNGTKHESFGSVLTGYGYHSSGTEVLYNGMTGEQVKSDIYIGPTYYMRLKQMVKDKINYRSQGPRTQLTRQTVQGRANDGGLRVGEMERDGILGHGASHFLNESLMVRGDEYHMAVCNKSGMIAIYNPNQNLFMSPMVDGPIKYSGALTDAAAAGGTAGGGGASVIQMTKFGRSFSVVRIPYCLKLLMQELLVMNVQMRIITDDNIDQLPSMSYSNNVYKVLKDGRGAMGVDDIIERNRLAAGLKPRPPVSSTQGRGAAGADEDESGKGSRVYLPSRSEAEEEAAAAAASGLGAGAFMKPLDVDDHPEDIILDLDIDTKASIHNFGWRFALKPDIARQMRGAGGGKGGGGGGAAAAAMTIQDLTGEDLVLESVILDKNGEPTEQWSISGAQWVGDYPTRFPDGWLSGMLVYPDDSPIAPSDMVEELRKTRKPLNWVRAIITLIEKRITRKSRSAYEKTNNVMDENSRNIAANAKELERVSSEIERAKREGNVAEEERLKVQMTRLTDERTTLNALRRDIEFSSGNEEAAAAAAESDEGQPKTPGYSSILDTSPVAPGGGGGGGAAEDANRLRGAVASFNEKMLEKYGKDDENIPSTDTSASTSEPSTPRTPPYSSSMFEGGGQRGGGSHGRGHTSNFIPQIPTGVLESYLSSRYSGGAAMNPVQSAAMAPFQQMGGGAGTGGSNLGSMMTMNVPVVATMPMAGMMPVQAQGGGGGGGGGGGQFPGQAQQSQQAQQPAAQTGGAAPPMASPTPNEAGVKTFSINLHR